MVRNTTGGNKSKSFARKSIQPSHKSSNLVLPSDPLEHFAVVSKVLGNGMCYVIIPSIKEEPIMCHIRKKFSGRFKKDNTIQGGTFLLVGLREWETTPKNCDVIEVYNHSDLAVLKTIPSFSFSQETISSSKATTDDSVFAFDENAETEEYSGEMSGIIDVVETVDTVDIDDI
jgi:translation initiation factor IF-1